MASAGDICPACGVSKLVRKEGVSAKTGKPWAGIFCEDRECVQPAQWIKQASPAKAAPRDLPQGSLPMGINPDAEARLQAATEAWKASVGDPKFRAGQALTGYQFIMAAYRGKLPEAEAPPAPVKLPSSEADMDAWREEQAR